MPKQGLILLALFMTGALLSGTLAGCGPAAPAAEKSVAYLSLADYTAAIAGLNVAADSGCEDYFKEVNSKGGVNGVKIRFIWRGYPL